MNNVTISKHFRPKEDITAYELAILWANVVSQTGKPISKEPIWFTEHYWATLPDNIKRHFE